MTNIVVYAQKGAVGGNVESVWGHEMQVCTIDSSNEKAVAAAKANGYSKSPHDVIEMLSIEAMESENNKMKSKLSSSEGNKRIKELEVELAGALIDNAKLESELKHANDKLAIYESSKDTNGNGKVDYEEMTNAELQKLLEQRKVEYNKRDGKDALIKAAKDSE